MNIRIQFIKSSLIFIATSFSFLCFFYTPAYPQKVIKADDFIAVSVNTAESVGEFYKLDYLYDSSSTIQIILYDKPFKITSQYIDKNYFLFIFQDKYNDHHLVGYFNDGDEWKADYFYVAIGYETELSSQTLKNATFIDGETLLLQFEYVKFTNEYRNNSRWHKETQNKIWRICKDKIHEYSFDDKIIIGSRKTGNNLRPEY